MIKEDRVTFDILKEKQYFLGPYWKKHNLCIELLDNGLW